MAISYVGGVQGGRAGSTSTTTQSLSGTLTGGSDTSPSTGDLVVVFCAAGSDGTGTPTSQTISGNNSGAYTALTFQGTSATTYDSTSQVNYFIQGGSVDTSLTIPSSGNARNAQRWIVHVFRGVDSSTPLDVTSTYATGTATGRPDPAAINPTTAGAWIAAFYASAAATGSAYTAPTDFATDWLGGTTVDTADCMTGGGYYTGWASGAYNPAAISAGGTTGANDSWTATTIALRPASATLTQAAFRFYEDGTETGSTAIAAQDTNILRTVTSDSNLQLRIRLQETVGSAGLSTDDYQLQYELNDSGTFYDIAAPPFLYYFDASDAGPTDPGGVWSSDANAFTSTTDFATTSTGGSTSSNYLLGEGTDAPASGPTINTVQARIKASCTEAEFIRAAIYTDGLGELLGTAERSSSVQGLGSLVSLSTPSGGWTWAKIQALETKIYLSSGTTSVDYVQVIVNGFPVVGYNSSSLTDGNATTNRLGSGSGSFVAGEISEDGLVDNFTHTASNYTEHLYSLTLQTSGLVNGDTLDFRVLRNGAAINTYTVYPRIVVSDPIQETDAIFQDSFTRAAQVDLESHTPDFGTSWSMLWQTDATCKLVVNTAGKAIANATVANSGFIYTADVTYPSADYEVKMTVTTGMTGSNRTYLIARLADVDNMYALRFTTGASVTRMYKKVAGTWTALGSFIADPAVGDVVSFKVSGSTLTYYYNGVLQDTQSDSDLTAAGKAGVAMGGGTNLASSTDDILSTASFDDFVVIAASSSVSVTPSVASLTASTFVPTVFASENKTATPSIATLTTSMFAPTVTVGTVVTPSIATLTTSTFAPTVTASDNKIVTPSIATLSTSTFAPTVAASDNKTVTPSIATLTTSTFAPSVLLNNIVTPSIASLTTSTFAPTVTATANQVVTPSIATLTTSLFAPTVAVTDNKIVTPSLATLTTSLFAPTVSTGANVTVTPDIATLATSTFAPTVAISDNKTVTPTIATLTTSTFAPTVTATANQFVTPSIATLTTSTFAPTVSAGNNQTATPSIATLTTSMFAPTVSVSDNKFVTPSIATLTTSTFAITVAASDNKTATPSVASLTISTFAPTVTATDNKTVTPSLATLTTATFAPTVTATANQFVTPSIATLTTSMFPPSVTTGDNKEVVPNTTSLSLSTFAITVAVSDNKLVTPSTASLTTSLFAPTVTTSNHIAVTPDAATLTTSLFAPTVFASDNITLTPNVVAMVTAMFAPTVNVGNNLYVTPQTASLHLTGQTPIINGIVPTRNYYIDSDAEVYWVVNPTIGLVERV